ncbi:hypothetical protein CR513_51774, partial [Mucuna pruriens]
MQTRAKPSIVQPRLHPTFLLTHMEPTTTKQALAYPTWYLAMKDEYDVLIHNNTWTLVPLPFDRHPIVYKWVFRVKENHDDYIKKHKAYLMEILGFDYNETFSLVLKPITIHIIITLSLTHYWPLKQLDVNNAFLNGFFDENVYMTQPPSLGSKLANVIHPCLFSLSTLWWSTFLSCNLLHIESLIVWLNTTFSLETLGNLDYFLGLEVKPQPDGSLVLTQPKYNCDLLAKTKMSEANSIASPMVSGCKLTKTSLLLVPYSMSQLLALKLFMMQPLEQSWSANKRILQYLKGIISWGSSLQLAPSHSPLILQACCDVDWAFELDDHWSPSKAFVFLGSNLMSSWSKKQTVVAGSNTEAKYQSIALATSETLLFELDVPHIVSQVLCDNMSTLLLTILYFMLTLSIWNLISSLFMKKVINKLLQVIYVLAVDQCPDILTKALSLTSPTLLELAPRRGGVGGRG